MLSRLLGRLKNKDHYYFYPPPSTLLDLIGVIKAHGLTSSNKLQAFNIETIKGTN